MIMADYSWRVSSNDSRLLTMDRNALVTWIERLLTVTCLRVEEWISSDISKPLGEIVKELAMEAKVSTNRVQIIAAPQYGNCEGVICRVYAVAGDRCVEFLSVKLFGTMSKAFLLAQELALTLDRIVNHGESPAVLGWHEGLGMPVNHWQRTEAGELVLEHGHDILSLTHGGRQITIAEGEKIKWLAEAAQCDTKLLASAMGIPWRYVKLASAASTEEQPTGQTAEA